jgi:hypothetical protein
MQQYKSNSTSLKVLEALRPFDLKQEAHGQYRCNSPFRAGANSHSFAVKVEDDEHGTWHDFVSDESGSLYDLAARLGIAPTPRPPVADTKRAYTGIEDYAKAHGITGEILKEWGWFETIYQTRRALQFITPAGNRWRFIDGNKPAYKSVQGYRRCWYGFNDTLLRHLQPDFPLVVCNGEISTITAQFYGVPAVCMTAGENVLEESHIKELRAFLHKAGLNPEILIALDCDKKGQTAARGMVTQLERHGFKARALDLGLGNKGDLADFCMLHTHSVIPHLLHLPEVAEVKPLATESGYTWRLVDEKELLSLPDMRWLIRGILPEAGLGMIYGASGSYKSFFALDMALKLAQQKNVVYVVAEGETGMKKRVLAWRKHNKIAGGNIRFVLGAVNLFEQDELVFFKDTIAQYQPALVVVDTLQMCIGSANENDGRDMKIIIDGCKLLTRYVNTSVVMVHHTNKEGIYERGSGVLRNSADTLIKIVREDDLARVSSEKTKDDKPFPAYHLAPVTIDLGYADDEGQPVTSLVLVPDEKIQEDGEILTELQQRVLNTIAVESMSVRDMAQEFGQNKSAVQRALNQLKKFSYIETDGQSRWLTDKGKNKLENETK